MALWSHLVNQPNILPVLFLSAGTTSRDLERDIRMMEAIDLVPRIGTSTKQAVRAAFHLMIALLSVSHPQKITGIIGNITTPDNASTTESLLSRIQVLEADNTEISALHQAAYDALKSKVEKGEAIDVMALDVAFAMTD